MKCVYHQKNHETLM